MCIHSGVFQGHPPTRNQPFELRGGTPQFASASVSTIHIGNSEFPAQIIRCAGDWPRVAGNWERLVTRAAGLGREGRVGRRLEAVSQRPIDRGALASWEGTRGVLPHRGHGSCAARRRAGFGFLRVCSQRLPVYKGLPATSLPCNQPPRNLAARKSRRAFLFTDPWFAGPGSAGRARGRCRTVSAKTLRPPCHTTLRPPSLGLGSFPWWKRGAKRDSRRAWASRSLGSDTSARLVG